MQNSNLVVGMESIVGKHHMLDHDFYKVAWNQGQLSLETLKYYVSQYYVLESNLPRFLSSAHSLSDDYQDRRILLDNIMDEEGGEVSHRDLLIQFGKNLGMSEEEILNTPLRDETKQMVDTYFALSRSSYAEAIAAMFAYESQASKVAHSKLQGLQEHYNIQDAKFFEVHMEADIWHTEQFKSLLERLPQVDHEKAYNACLQAAKSLNIFLDGMLKVHRAEGQTLEI